MYISSLSHSTEDDSTPEGVPFIESDDDLKLFFKEAKVIVPVSRLLQLASKR